MFAITPNVIIFAIIKQISAGKLRKDVHARLFALFAEPRSQTIQRDDEIAVVLEWRRCDRRTQRHLRRQIEKVIFVNWRFEWRALRFEIGDQFAQRFRQEIFPVLQEYCYDDYTTLAQYLGTKLINTSEQSANEDLLSDPSGLIEALMELVSEQA